jgi:heptosyltransferase-1
MRVLVIKTSSLGDVIHTLPALTDAARAIPGIRFDWVVEERFAEIPAWHPAVDRVIPVAVRRWRKHPLQAWRSGEWRAFVRSLAGPPAHDLAIDAQGLLKSAWLSRYAHAPVHGLDRRSAREGLASLFYHRSHGVAGDQHAVQRVRALFADALGYARPESAGTYGLDRARVVVAATDHGDAPYLMFLHGTTWDNKHWPQWYWQQLIEHVTTAGWQVRLPWGDETERERATRLAQGHPGVTVLPALSLGGVAAQLAGARACVAVDTGLGHLAAALDIPTISLFGPTHPGLTGAWGHNQVHLASDLACAPCLARTCTHRASEDERNRYDLAREQPLCFTRLDPTRVWQALDELLQRPQPEQPPERRAVPR